MNLSRRLLVSLVLISLLSSTGLGFMALPSKGAQDYFSWDAMDTGTTKDISGITAVDASHVWAVGGDNYGVGGAVFFFNGSSWRKVYGDLSDELYDVYALDNSHVWAVGNNGLILFFNGSSWITQNSGTGNLLWGIYSLDASHVWAVGNLGTIVFFDGDSWTTQDSGVPDQDLFAVTATSANSAWAVGSYNTIVRFQNGSWVQQTTTNQTRWFYGVSATDANHVWAVGDKNDGDGWEGRACFFNGSSWKDQTIPQSGTIRSVYAFNNTNVWAVGQYGAAIFFNGSRWTAQASGTGYYMRDIWAANSYQAWMAGENGTIIFGNGPPPNPPPINYYLAEGTTAWGFNTYITILNPNKTIVTANISYMTAAGAYPGGKQYLAPQSQTTVYPEYTLGERDFSTKVTSLEGRPLSIDRTMSWYCGDQEEGHASVCVSGPAKTWYLPEGSSKWGFESWLLIQNPSASAATCTVNYMTENDGTMSVVHQIPASSRLSYSMKDDIGEKDASIQVISDVPVIPERSMYRNNRREGHCSIGTTSPSKTYYLAEGTSAWGFTTYVLVQNPNPYQTEVAVTYMTEDGPVSQPSVTMPANSRKTIRVNDILGNKDFSTMVRGSSPIIAERAMYWDNGSGEACHDSIGMSGSHSAFYLPDGETSLGRETWTLVQNPNSSPVTVEISYYVTDGTANRVFRNTIAANARKTFSMADYVYSGRAGITVTSKTAGLGIMVERAMYWNNRGAGTDTIGGSGDWGQ